ncbi:MAG TPA: LysM peptidoglycan-binding domain-containing protein [Flavisolibacter sp.]|jgi:LysM repeat protein|nr:LysM peptidoglycan-binding domain-containing protein [Flavisolibacter sp.]
MKRIVFVAIIFLCCHGVFAQNLVVQHNSKGAYLVHTVAPKENFYSLGRLYNIPPKDIAAFNGLEMERGLNIGQMVNIPLINQNFSQEATTANPVYYVVGEKEGLYRVSVNNNKVLMANLRKWNNLNSDVISPGQRLIVGYLVSNEMSSYAAARPQEPARQQEVAKVSEERPAQQNTEVRSQPKTETAVPERRTETVAAEKKPEQPRTLNTTVNDGNGGYFKASFEAQIKAQPVQKDEVAAAGIFKTASGWQDAKYYALLDNVEPGTIIRIVNPNNNKAVYAKVLDKMTGIRQNQGYDLRISNAAATALDINETDKFFVRVNY